MSSCRGLGLVVEGIDIVDVIIGLIGVFLLIIDVVFGGGGGGDGDVVGSAFVARRRRRLWQIFAAS